MNLLVARRGNVPKRLDGRGKEEVGFQVRKPEEHCDGVTGRPRGEGERPWEKK